MEKSFVDISSETFKFFTVRDQDVVKGLVLYLFFFLFFKIKSVLSVERGSPVHFEGTRGGILFKILFQAIFHLRYLLD